MPSDSSCVHTQRRQKQSFTVTHLWAFSPPHRWLVWEHPQAEEWIRFQSSMADYSWQGLTSSWQHWSHNWCFVSLTLQSLKDKTVFSFAHQEGNQLESCDWVLSKPRNSVFLMHQAESFDFKPHILPLLHSCRRGNESTRWMWAGASQPSCWWLLPWTVVARWNIY